MSTRQRELLEGICDEFEKTIAHFDWVKAGSRGMHVPFHGDFASVVHFPGVIIVMRRWVREFRRALDEEKSEIGKNPTESRIDIPQQPVETPPRRTR